MTEREKLIEKIRKLMALGSSANPHEAELALAKASELMSEYQIGHADVSIIEARAGVRREEYTVKDQKMRLRWISILAYGVAKLYDGSLIDNGGLHKTSFAFIGFPTDILAMKMTFEHLYHSWFSIVESDLQETKLKAKGFGTWTPGDTMKFKAGHGLAFATAIHNRCVSEAAKRMQQVLQTATGTDLVVVRTQEVENYMDSLKLKKSSTSTISTGSEAGRSAGRVAGTNIALGGAINHTRRIA